MSEELEKTLAFDDSGSIILDRPCTDPQVEIAPHSTFRVSTEFLVSIIIAVLLFNRFVLEANFVPTGSMGPTICGEHYCVRCPHCDYRFQVGKHTLGISPQQQWICKNCKRTFENGSIELSPGDQLLVSKYSYSLFSPERWDLAVFRKPDDRHTLYVKRIAGLPGEEIQIAYGNVYVNGQIARKSLELYRSVALSVYDDSYRSESNHDETGRWNRWAHKSTNSKWTLSAEGLAIKNESENESTNEFDVISYRHLNEDGDETAINDWLAYNNRRTHRYIQELSIQGVLFCSDWVGQWKVIGKWEDKKYELFLDMDNQSVSLVFDGNQIQSYDIPVAHSLTTMEFFLGVVDERLYAQFGKFKWEYDLDGVEGKSSFQRFRSQQYRPIEFQAKNANLKIEQIKIQRDIHYLSGKSSKYVLNDDEYFMLGDNSANSTDSRMWESFGIKQNQIVGKPFYIHYPGCRQTLSLFGRTFKVNMIDFDKFGRLK